MLRRVALVRTYFSEERSASFISVPRIVEIGTTLAVTSNQSMVMEALRSSETSVLTRAPRRNIPEDITLQAKLCLQGQEWRFSGHKAASFSKVKRITCKCPEACVVRTVGNLPLLRHDPWDDAVFSHRRCLMQARRRFRKTYREGVIQHAASNVFKQIRLSFVKQAIEAIYFFPAKRIFHYFPSQIYNLLYSGVISKCVVG
jgi:hypothetical protein